MIIIHEIGHFVTAKKSGVKVNEFWLGMGPTLLKKKVGETVYTLKLLPLGGAVVMEGEDEESEDVRSFSNAKIQNRALIIVAGAVMNFVIGFLIILIVLMPVKQIVVPEIDSFADGFKYENEQMLMVNDEILKIDSYKIRLTSDISFSLSRTDGKPIDILVKRDGQKVLLTDVPIKPDMFIINGDEVLRYGINFKLKNATIVDSIKFSLNTGINYARLVWTSLGDLIGGKVGVNQLSGPIGVTEVLVNSAEENIKSFFLLVAFISINLGVMNLLPLPALDGGRLLFIIIEFLRRGKKVNPKYEGYVHAVGLVLLLGLMLFVTGNDIFKLISRLN